MVHKPIFYIPSLQKAKKTADTNSMTPAPQRQPHRLHQLVSTTIPNLPEYSTTYQPATGNIVRSGLKRVKFNITKPSSELTSSRNR